MTLLVTGAPLKGQDVNLEQGLRYYIKFNSSLEDRSSNNIQSDLDGTVYRKDRFGNCDFALGFEGYLQLLKIGKEAFNNLSDFSVSLWMKTENSGFGTFLSVANSSRDNELNLNVLQDGTIASNIRNQPNVPGIRIDGSKSVKDGEWHHVVLTRLASTGMARIYVDNTLDAEKQMPLGVIQVSDNGAVLGNDQDCLAGCYSANQQYYGLLDDLRVYDRVLNNNEIKALFDLSEAEANQEPLGSVESVETCDQQLTLSLKRAFDSFTWNTGATTSTINVSSSGQYIVTGMVADCIYSDTTNVQINQIPDLQISANELDLTCNSSIELVVNGVSFDSYEWSNGEAGATLLVDTPGTYYVQGTYDCGIVTSNQIVVTKSQIIEEVGIIKERIYTDCGDRALLTASGGLDNYLWSTGENSDFIQVDEGGEYTVTAYNVCGDQLTASVIVEGMSRDSYFIPNAFTPNGDRINDYFELDQRLLGAKLLIFNRWGQRIYESLEYKNDWSGQNAQSGVYYFSIDHECLLRPIKGWVRILK
ncbi:MAG: gliding motility-associated C-terminal domain-containing protein [Cytophagia bacterium]|nr:gliding motility-associated C-terminal domain-containing protein [Cytophagia bacterium]